MWSRVKQGVNRWVPIIYTQLHDRTQLKYFIYHYPRELKSLLKSTPLQTVGHFRKLLLITSGKLLFVESLPFGVSSYFKAPSTMQNYWFSETSVSKLDLSAYASDRLILPPPLPPYIKSWGWLWCLGERLTWPCSFNISGHFGHDHLRTTFC